MILWLALFTSLLRADDMTTEKFCLSSPLEAAQAQKYIASITVPVDRVEKSESCLIVSTRPHRRELLQKFMLAQYPHMAVSFSSEETKRDPCELKVEKVGAKKSEGTKVDVGLPTGASAQQAEASSTETMHITTLKDFELSFDQEKILGQCRYITPNSYEITIAVLKEPKIQPHPTIRPVDQETSALRTTVQLMKGNRIEIGSLLRELKNKSHEVGVPAKAHMQDDVRNLEERIFLSIQ